jgi:DNA-binding winged helix-turn-helix (wHTH) protein/tetratricopeptide (TPR) repeat protein
VQAGQALHFGPFQLDPQNARLWRGKRLIALTPKAFAVLCQLVEHAGQLVTKEALLTAVWPEIYVSEGVLSECVRELRHALGDTPQSPRFIETVHRRGYCFLPTVTTRPVISNQLSVVSPKHGKRSRSRLATGNWQLTTPLVGREAELRQLYGWLNKALRGERQLVFVTGEAGIGKTSVVEAFLQSLESSVQSLASFGQEANQKAKVSEAQSSALSPHSLSSPIPNSRPLTPGMWVGRGQCIDHYGQGEAYLPVLEALGRMCREPEGNQLVELLAQHAPTWLVQMPALLPTSDLEALQRRTQGATRERMLRELAEAVEVLSAERPLVLVLEDLHWSDVSTLDWLAFVARRREPARLLIIGAYRPVEVIVGDHSLKLVKQELQLHEQCDELPLRFLTEEHVAKYLARRTETEIETERKQDRVVTTARGSKEATGVPQLARLIHQRTEGNPLFMVNLVDYLVSQGVLTRIDGHWRLQGEATSMTSWVPESLQQMIEKQIEQLSAKDRRVLEVASVAGAEFSAAAVAAGAGIAVEAVEEQCEELARHEQFLRARGTAEWPDGTVAARYGFQHALYQDVLYGRLTARRRQRLHQQIGEQVERAHGERAKEIAAELAVHFERGRGYRKTVQYLQQAGENAVRRSAYQEAITHLTKGLELLKTLPDTPERARQELFLQTALGPALMVAKGPGTPEVGQAYARARELCLQVGQTPQLFSVLRGLSAFYWTQAELETARELAEQCLSLAQNARNPTYLVWAHHLLGCTLYTIGEFAQARAHWEAGIALYDSQQQRSALGNPVVESLSYLAWHLWFLGYPDQALQRIHAALTLAQELSRPYSLASALNFAGFVHHLRREVQAGQERAEALIALSTEQGFPHLLALGAIRRGWALALQGQVEEGIPQIRQGITAYRTMGTELGQLDHFAYLAEAYGKGGQIEEGLTVLAEALALVDRTGECWYEAELYRLRGELTLAQSKASLGQVSGKSRTSQEKSENPNTQPPTPSTQAEAEACFLKAIEIAQKQQAKSLELRAVMSLVRLRQHQAQDYAPRNTHHGSRTTQHETRLRLTQAHRMLSEIYNWFTEGFDTKDLQEAKALLEQLSY